jgi:predicted amidophosphoribosyltransferase
LHFDGCVALWTYDGLVRNAVIAAKYGSQVALADALGRRLGQRVLQAWELGINGSAERPQPARARSGPEEPHGAEETPTPELVTGVPSHLFRRIQRGGGGGSALVASLHRVLRQRWSHCRLADVLTTTRRVKKQALMGESQRTANVRDAFALRRRRWRPRTPRRASGHLELAGRHVLLVDDVMTTGATADENARVLKLAGASRVTVAVVARAVGGC